MAEVSRGAAGEVLAARFLREKGYTLLTANYRCRQGEVDIIAADASYIVFVEVKTRQQGALYAPREAVDAAKQHRIIARQCSICSGIRRRCSPALMWWRL